MASRKLKHYFQEHPIIVASSVPLPDIIQNREETGRIAKWAIELGAYHIKYKPQTAIKSQALADFINDWTESKHLRRSQSPNIGRYTSMEVGSSKGQEPAWSLPHLKGRNSTTFCSCGSLAPTTQQSMKPYFMGYGWLVR